MTSFSFLTASDIHISDSGPRSRVDDFKATILGKIGQICMAANKLNVDATLIAGDLFNLKNPSKNSHNLNQELIKVFKQFKSPIFMIEGNHDLTGNNIDSLSEQPLGVLFADGTICQLRNELIEKDGFKVSIIGFPFKDSPDLTHLKDSDKADAISRICLMHIYAAPTPGMLFKERIFGYKEIASVLPSVDIFVFGHYHLDQGVEEIEGKRFINLGSVTRGTLSDEDVQHKPKIGFIKIAIENGKPSYTVQTINLKIKPATEIFDLKRRDEERREMAEIEAFVDKLMTHSISETSRTLDEVLGAMDMTKAVRDKVMHFLHEAKTT